MNVHTVVDVIVINMLLTKRAQRTQVFNTPASKYQKIVYKTIVNGAYCNNNNNVRLLNC